MTRPLFTAFTAFGLASSAGALAYGIYLKSRDIAYEDGWSSVSDEFVGWILIGLGAIGVLVALAAIVSRK